MIGESEYLQLHYGGTATVWGDSVAHTHNNHPIPSIIIEYNILSGEAWLQLMDDLDLPPKQGSVARAIV